MEPSPSAADSSLARLRLHLLSQSSSARTLLVGGEVFSIRHIDRQLLRLPRKGGRQVSNKPEAYAFPMPCGYAQREKLALRCLVGEPTDRRRRMLTLNQGALPQPTSKGTERRKIYIALGIFEPS